MAPIEETFIDEQPLTLKLPTISPGADWTWSFQVLDDNDDPVNTTGYTARMHLRPTPNGELVKELTTSSGITNSTATGTFTILYPDTETDDINHTKLVWDLYLTDNSGLVSCILAGTVQVRTRVTK